MFSNITLTSGLSVGATNRLQFAGNKYPFIIFSFISLSNPFSRMSCHLGAKSLCVGFLNFMLNFSASSSKASILLSSSGSLTSWVDNLADVEGISTSTGVGSSAVLSVEDKAPELFASLGINGVSDPKATCCCKLFILVNFIVFLIFL